MIAETERSRAAAVVRNTAAGIEVYRFETDWIPVAGSVKRSDGYGLADESMEGRKLFSIIIHTQDRLLEYGITVMSLVGIAGAWRTSSRIPKRGKLAWIRALTFAGLAVAAIVIGLILSLFPISPFIALAMCGSMVGVWFVLRRSVWWRPKLRQAATPSG